MENSKLGTVTSATHLPHCVQRLFSSTFTFFGRKFRVVPTLLGGGVVLVTALYAFKKYRQETDSRSGGKDINFKKIKGGSNGDKKIGKDPKIETAYSQLLDKKWDELKVSLPALDQDGLEQLRMWLLGSPDQANKGWNVGTRPWLSQLWGGVPFEIIFSIFPYREATRLILHFGLSCKQKLYNYYNDLLKATEGEEQKNEVTRNFIRTMIDLGNGSRNWYESDFGVVSMDGDDFTLHPLSENVIKVYPKEFSIYEKEIKWLLIDTRIINQINLPDRLEMISFESLYYLLTTHGSEWLAGIDRNEFLERFVAFDVRWTERHTEMMEVAFQHYKFTDQEIFANTNYLEYFVLSNIQTLVPTFAGLEAVNAAIRFNPKAASSFGFPITGKLKLSLKAICELVKEGLWTDPYAASALSEIYAFALEQCIKKEDKEKNYKLFLGALEEGRQRVSDRQKAIQL